MDDQRAIWNARAKSLIKSIKLAREGIDEQRALTKTLTDVGRDMKRNHVILLAKLNASILTGELFENLNELEQKIVTRLVEKSVDILRVEILKEAGSLAGFVGEIIPKAKDLPLEKINGLADGFLKEIIIELLAQETGLSIAEIKKLSGEEKVDKGVVDQYVNDLERRLTNAEGDKIYPQTTELIELEEQTPILKNRLITLNTLFFCLEEFARRQFFFFFAGFYDGIGITLEKDALKGEDDVTDGQFGYLSHSNSYPASFVYRATLDQTSFDLTVLENAYKQSLYLFNGKAALKTIRLADQYANYLLQLVGLTGWIEESRTQLLEPTVGITYYRKAALARVVPYGPIALIGIPNTIIGAIEYVAGNKPEDVITQPNVSDFLAIPHEVGHYVFWHGVIEILQESDEDPQKVIGQTRRIPLRRALFDLLEGEPEWLLGWAEEIFADVFAALTAGGAAAQTAQEIRLDDEPSLLLSFDKSYPIGALRPTIYTTVLTVIGFERASDLEEQWAKNLRRRQINSTDKVEGSWEEPLTLEEILYHIRTVIVGCLFVIAGQYKNEALMIAALRRHIYDLRGRPSPFPQKDIEAIATLISDSISRVDTKHGDISALISDHSALINIVQAEVENIGEKIPRPVIELPKDFADFVEQMKKLTHSTALLPTLELVSKRNEETEVLTYWRLMGSGIQEEDYPAREVGDSVRISGGKIRDAFIELLKNEESDFGVDRLPPAIWEVIFSMNGWTTGGPEVEANPKIR